MLYISCFKSQIPKNIYTFTAYTVIFLLIISSRCNLNFYALQTNEAKIKLPILMYHGFTNDEKSSEYVLDISDFEKDLVYLKENGYTFINTYDLVNYVYHGINLPEKPVMITIDDGYLNNYTYAYPLIKKYNIKAVISPIAYYVEYYSYFCNEENPLYSILNDKYIKEMHSDGLIDFQNHSYNMHSLKERKGSSKKSNEKTEDYIREFYYDLKAAENVIKEITGEKTHAYAYPFGIYSSESLSILKCCDYKVTLSCIEGVNYVTKDKNSLYMLKRFNRTPQKSAKQLLSQY